MKISSEVATVAQARSGLSAALRRFRQDGSASPVILGSHRKAEAALVPIALYERLTDSVAAPSPRPVLSLLRERRQLVQRLAQLNHITAVSVVGSVARGAETPESDIDLLVETSDRASLYDLAQFAVDVEQLTGRRVDVLSLRSLLDDDTTILAEAIPL